MRSNDKIVFKDIYNDLKVIAELISKDQVHYACFRMGLIAGIIERHLLSNEEDINNNQLHAC